MAKKKVDIVIVGAGLIGSALALWLVKHGNFKVALIERNKPMAIPELRNERVVALGRLATNFLREIGVFQQLGEDRCHAYQRMCVWDENSDGVLDFDADSLNVEASLGAESGAGDTHLGHMVDSLYCNYLSQQAVLENDQIESNFDAQLLSLDLSGERGVLICDQHEFTANLVVAADGAGSWVRQASKIFANHRDYDQRGIVTRIVTERTHENCAWQRFLSTGPLALLPLANNQSSIVWSADNSVADELLALSDLEFARRLKFALQDRLGDVQVLTERRGFPLRSLRVNNYFKRGVVLVGDAAHSIHPLAGQGANLGFKDILCLGGLISNVQSAHDLSSPRLLASYEAVRQADNNQTDALMSALHGAYRNNSPMWMAARGLGMNILNRSKAIRQLLAQHASGI